VRQPRPRSTGRQQSRPTSRRLRDQSRRILRCWAHRGRRVCRVLSQVCGKCRQTVYSGRHRTVWSLPVLQLLSPLHCAVSLRYTIVKAMRTVARTWRNFCVNIWPFKACLPLNCTRFGIKPQNVAGNPTRSNELSQQRAESRPHLACSERVRFPEHNKSTCRKLSRWGWVIPFEFLKLLYVAEN